VLGARDLWSDAKKLFAYGFGGASDRPTVVAAGMVGLPSMTPPAPAPAVSAEGDDVEARPRYAVRLGPYATRRAALATRARLARRGYTAVLAGRTLRIGSFSSAARAGRVAGRLRQSGYSPLVVQL
jgi:cell division protein FtsN